MRTCLDATKPPLRERIEKRGAKQANIYIFHSGGRGCSHCTKPSSCKGAASTGFSSATWLAFPTPHTKSHTLTYIHRHYSLQWVGKRCNSSSISKASFALSFRGWNWIKAAAAETPICLFSTSPLIFSGRGGKKTDSLHVTTTTTYIPQNPSFLPDDYRKMGLLNTRKKPQLSEKWLRWAWRRKMKKIAFVLFSSSSKNSSFLFNESPNLSWWRRYENNLSPCRKKEEFV